jgi:negative regulator of replication initiation
MTTNSDDVLFARGDAHDCRIQVLATADEFLFARDHAKELGISASCYLRKLLNDDRRLVAQKQLSAQQEAINTPIPTQELHTIVEALSILINRNK